MFVDNNSSGTMADVPEEMLRELPLRTKKQRQRKFQHKQFSAVDMKSSLQEMIKSGIKNAAVIDLLRNGLNQTTISDHRIGTKRLRSEAEEEVIAKIEEKEFNFFTAKGETCHFKRSIDNVLSKLSAKFTTEPLPLPQVEHSEEARSMSPMRTRYSKQSKQSSAMSKRKQSRKCDTLPSSGGVMQLNRVLMNDLSDARRRRTNTFLFNIPTRKIPKKTSQVQYKFECDWEEQLLENVNILQGSNIRHKKNVKVEREKVAAYLRGRFVSEAVTTYYKFQPTESFAFLKSVVEELVRVGEKELRLITFFTYDANQDGFICEEDIYHFISRLPHRAHILQDFNRIIEFLRTNQLRSTSTNLPEKLLKLRQKSLFSSLDEEAPAFKDPPKKYSFTEKLFTVASNYERDTQASRTQTTAFKKFQINFEVFSLIFAEKMPVLVPEIIMSLTRPIPDPRQPFRPPAAHCPSTPPSKEGEWGKRMSRTKEILEVFQSQNRRLSQKID